MNWLHYLLEANLYLGVFYLGYYLFLSRETYYTLNRIYLLFSCIASFALPVFQLGILKPVVRPVTEVNFAFPTFPTTFVPVTPVVAAPVFTWQDALVDGYVLGAIILLVILLIKLYSLYQLTRSRSLATDGKYKLLYIDQSTTAFSFFNYLFIGTNVDGSETIIRHELVHIKQKHSFDIIFIELLKIVNWFNPVIYLIQYSLRTLHEYIADEQTATAENDAFAYSSFLVNNAYGLGGSSITHSFFNYNLLKKRIIMLHQKRSGSLVRLKYLVAVPICAGLLCASTLAFSKSYGWVDIGPHRIDKNNKSSQVAEPKRSLLVRQHGVSVISDKFIEEYPDGSKRTYTANNISNKDKVDLAKQGIQISVLSDVMIELTEKDLAAKNPITSGYTNTGNKYKIRWFTHDNKINYLVIVYDKNGSKILNTERAANPAGVISLGRKYGFKFSDEVVIRNDTFKSIIAPTPTPAPPVKPKVNRFPPPIVTLDTTPHKSPPKKLTMVRLLPPPPPPFDPAYKDLSDYLNKNVHYPSVAFESQETGDVVVQFSLNSDHKITDVKLVSGDETAFNNEVIRVIKNFPGNITPSAQHSYYLTGVSFNITGDNGIKKAKDFDKSFSQSDNYTCVTELYGYTKGDIKN